MSGTNNPLKKFNELLAKEIERANAYEKAGSLEQAKKQWLDIIEYCRLFAKKTTDLKPATAAMILQKAEKLQDRIRALDTKGPGPATFPSKPHGGDRSMLAEDSPSIIEDDESPGETRAPPASMSRPAPVAGGMKGDAEKKFINVGNQNIEVPDDFPLVEITPKDSFKPPSVPSEKMEIDKTRFTVGGKPPGDNRAEPKPAKPGPNKPRA